MVKLKAVRPMTYATRMLKAGEPFEAVTETDAHVLTLAGLAKKNDDDENDAPSDDAWARYETLAGRPGDRRWGHRRLDYEIKKLSQ